MAAVHRNPEVVVTELAHTPSWPGIEAATQTFHRGSPLVTSSGKLAEAGANPRDILGLADAAASGVTNTEVIMTPIHPGVTKVRMSLDKASGLGTHTLAQTDVWAVYGITKDANGFWYVDIDKVTAGTNTAVMVVALVDPIGAASTDTATDKNSGAELVDVVFLAEALATQTAAS